MPRSCSTVSLTLRIQTLAPSGGGQGDSASGGTWAAKGQLGLIMTSGNSTTRSGNARFDAAHAMGRWTLSGGLAALYASTGRYTTQQDTSAHLQADLALSRRTFWFSTARWDRNLFSGFAYQESIASGGGFKFIQRRPPRAEPASSAWATASSSRKF